MRTSRLLAGPTAALVVLGLAACSGEDPAAPQSLTVLTSWTSGTPQSAILADVAADFEEATGVRVTITEAGEDIPEVYETSLAGGREADVVIVNLAEKSVDWVANGAVVAAEEYLDEWGLRDRILPEALQEWEDSDGRVQGFPFQGFTWPVWFNTALLEQAGITEIPQTIEELIDAADQLTAAGVPTMVVGGNDWSGQKLFLQIAQSYLPPEEAVEVYSTGAFCTSENAMKGIDLFVRLRDAGVFVNDVEGYTADQMNAAFYQGQAAIMSAGSWAFDPAPEDLMPSIVLGGLPIPQDGVYDRPTAMQGYTGSGFWISPNGEEKIDLVRDFISAFYEPEVTERFASEASTVTAVIAEGELEITNPLLADAMNDLQDVVDFVVMPDTVVPGAVADPMIRQTSLAFSVSSGQDSQAICESMASVYP